MKKLNLAAVILISAIAISANASPRALSEARKAGATDGPKFEELEGSDRTEAIADVEKYLSGISSVVANFTQTSSDGSKGDGKFFLKRPGKMRWQYNPPTPILLISDGKTVVYIDSELDQVTYIDMDDTLASFLVKKDIKLDSDSIKLTGFSEAEGLYRAKVVNRKKPSEGSLTLEFVQKPMQIKRMIAVDATGVETTVDLARAEFGPIVDDKLFTYTDPRGVNYKRNKKKI